MSLIGSVAAPAAAQVSAMQPQGVLPQIGGGMPLQGPGAAMVGGVMPQKGGIGTIIKSVLGFGVGGAALGAVVGLIPAAIPFIGPLSIPTGAIIGGVAGAVFGLIKGVVKNKQAKQLAMQASGSGQDMLAPTISANDPNTYSAGAKNAKVRYTQNALRKLGIYKGPANGVLNKQTEKAISEYEVLKGLAPTGASSPEVRAALSFDLRAIKQFRAG